MNIDCTLNTFAVPGFTGLNPAFGTKKQSGDSISARENHFNVAMALSLMRPHIVNENSTTTELEANHVFDIVTAGVTLQIGDAVFNGCKAYIINSSADSVEVLVNETLTISLFSGDIIDLEYVDGVWSRRSGKQVLRSLSEFDFIDDDPVVASTANVDITTGGNIAIDGVSLVNGDRVLLKDQTNATENGYWIVQSGIWNRDPNYAAGNQTAFSNKFISPKRGSQRGKIFFLVQDRYTIGSTALDFIESTYSIAPMPGKIPLYDRNGMLPAGTLHADMIEGIGRDLRQVFGIASTDPTVYIPLIMAEIRRCCNNNGEIDSTGIPDFSGIEIGDYIDGLDLSGISVAPGGNAPQAWNDTYKNNRIVVSGFNYLKNAGDVENVKNHILFTFRNIICQGRMNPTNTNAGGYMASEMRIWLDGANGDGSGTLATKIKSAIGGNYLYTVRRLLSTKGTDSWAWANYTVFLLSEHEVFGSPHWSESGYGDGLAVQCPIFQKSTVYRIKRFNGSRHWWWLSSPHAANATTFCIVYNRGSAHNHGGASEVSGGVAPAFCVA